MPTVLSLVRSSRKKPKGAMNPDRLTWMSPPSLRRQPVRSTACGPGLCNSIHSSLAEADVPAQAISLISTVCGDTAVGFSEGGVGEEVAVTSGGVGEGVAVTSLGVGVDVISGVDVEVGSPGVPLDVGPGTGVGEGVGLDSGEGEGVVVGESPGSVVGVGVSLAAEAVEVSTLVALGLGEGASEASSSAGAPGGVELGASTER